VISGWQNEFISSFPENWINLFSSKTPKNQKKTGLRAFPMYQYSGWRNVSPNKAN
jgi:hypothetical protein